MSAKEADGRIIPIIFYSTLSLAVLYFVMIGQFKDIQHISAQVARLQGRGCQSWSRRVTFMQFAHSAKPPLNGTEKKSKSDFCG